MRQRVVAPILAIVWLSSYGPAWSAPGDSLYVQKATVNVRTGPGTDSAVLLKLTRGQELTEFSRQGQWINVGIARTGGKDGWIHSSLVGSVSPGGGTLAPADPTFDAFARDVETLNGKVQAAAGFPFFTRVENMGDGIVQLTAHDKWLAAPLSNRNANVETLFALWTKHEGSGLPVAVYIADSTGKLVMKRASR